MITYSRKVFIPLTRLCRDRCGYCTFVTVPGRLRHGSAFLSPDEVLDIARQGAALGCKEALFTLGDRPEARWRQAREWLDAHGYDDTLSYVRAMAIRVLEETGLLPHLNPGVLTWQDFQRLKPVAPSMGMMLETTAQRLFTEPGGPHFGSPDKDPAVRLRVLEDAGRSAVPFTTGILIGIGETLAERADSIFAIRGVAREYGGVQEVIVQNFRAKPDTKMRAMPDAELDDLAATIAVARLVLGPSMRIQAPPNLIGEEYQLILDAGIDDWGGVSPLTPDHVNPERPWPQIDDLAAADRRRRVRAARAAHDLPRLPRASRGSTRGCGARGRAGRPGDRPGRARTRCPLACRGRSRTAAGASRRAGPTCTSRSTRRAAPPTGAATSTRSTATGPRSPGGSTPRPGAGTADPAPARLRAEVAAGAAQRRARPGRPDRRGGAGPARRRRPRARGAGRRWPTRSAATSTATTSPTW